MRNSFARVIGVLVCGLIAGCATVGMRSVSVSLVSVEPVDASVFESAIAVTLRFANESNQPVTFTGGAYRLYVNGIAIGRGVVNESLSLAPFSTATQRIPMFIENVSVIQKVRAWANLRRIHYRIEGRAESVESGGVRLETEGELDAMELLSATQELR